MTEVIPDLGELLQWLLDKYQMSVAQQHTIDILRQQLDAPNEAAKTAYEMNHSDPTTAQDHAPDITEEYQEPDPVVEDVEPTTTETKES